MNRINRYQKYFYLGLIVLYSAIAVGVGFLHAHEMDGLFHDDCPACQWEIQFREPDSVTAAIWQHIHQPCIMEFAILDSDPTVLDPQSLLGSVASRAPPVA